jgi:tRNA C32,U32 (ribose-2'-O)-methylase TrmJ
MNTQSPIGNRQSAIPMPEPRVPGPETSWRIVLVRPRNPLNIGAAARAMANFGLSDLVVVEPYGPAWQETRSAVGAGDIIRSARAAGSLTEALDGITLVIGTTSGQRRKLDRDLLSLEDLSEWIGDRARHRTRALLFGSEKAGLSNEHFSYCHALLRIPTSARCPSMNLGQAVAVCCFELSRIGWKGNWGLGAGDRPSVGSSQRSAFSLPPAPNPCSSKTSPQPPIPSYQPPAPNTQAPPAGVQCLEHVFERAVRVLDEVGYLKPKTRRATIIKLRRMLVDRGLSSRDAKILGGILAQIEWKLKNRG